LPVKPAVLLCLVRGIDHMAAALLERADVEIISLYSESAALLAKCGIPHRSLDDFFTKSLGERVMATGKPRAQAIMAALHGSDLKDEYGFDDPTWTAVRDAVTKILDRDYAEELATVEMVRRMACETDLRLVIVPEDICRDTKTVVSVARRLGIPSLHVLHGFPYGTTNAHAEVNADVIAAYSDRAKSICEGWGADPNRVFVTGNPMWDCYAGQPAPGTKERVCANLGLDPNRPIVEYALTGVHRFSAVSIRHPRYHIESAETVVAAFARLGRRRPDWQFLLRVHPFDPSTADGLIARANDLGLENVRLDDQPAYDTMVTVDALVCTHSNMGIEAILLDVPVVNVAIDALAGPVFREGMGPLFLDDDAVLWARVEDEVEPAVEAAVLDEPTRQRLREMRPKSIERFNHANDGQATERVCDLALDMIRQGEAYLRQGKRYPDAEVALAGCIPHDARAILVAGEAAPYVADAVTAARPEANIETVIQFEPDGPADFDAVVLADPVPHDASVHAVLRAAAQRLGEKGVVVATFRNGTNREATETFRTGRWAPPRRRGGLSTGTGQYCPAGIELVLSRCGLEPVEPVETEQLDLQTSVMVAARRRPVRLSPLGEERRQQRLRAHEANLRGETAYNDGDMIGALTAFTEAVTTWNEEALYFSNLATTLHAVGESEKAYGRLLDALFLNPNLQVARDNFRMVAAHLERLDEAEETLRRFGADAG